MAPTKKSAASVKEPQQPGLDDMAQSVTQAKLKLEEAETLQAARIAEIAQEEEDASAAVTTAAKQEETSQLHLQLTWEQNYLNRLRTVGCRQTGGERSAKKISGGTSIALQI